VDSPFEAVAQLDAEDVEDLLGSTDGDPVTSAEVLASQAIEKAFNKKVRSLAAEADLAAEAQLGIKATPKQRSEAARIMDVVRITPALCGRGAEGSRCLNSFHAACSSRR
jgi:hypothetical protein